MYSTADKDHEVDVEVVANGVTLETQNFSWSGLEAFVAVIDTVNFDALQPAHGVKITCRSGADFILVDWIEASYPRTFKADNDALKFTHETGYTFGVSGFGSNNLLAFDISDPADVGRVVTTAALPSWPTRRARRRSTRAAATGRRPPTRRPAARPPPDGRGR